PGRAGSRSCRGAYRGRPRERPRARPRGGGQTRPRGGGQGGPRGGGHRGAGCGAAGPGPVRRRGPRAGAAAPTSRSPPTGATQSDPRWGSVADSGEGRPGLSTAGAGVAGVVAGSARAPRLGRPRAIRLVRRASPARYQPPLVVVSRTGWPEAMKVRGPPAAYGQTDWRTLFSLPAPLGKVQVMVEGGPAGAG